MQEKDSNGDFLSEYIRKIKQPGIALCIWCDKQLKYASAGKKVLHVHSTKDVHRKARRARSNTQQLPIAFQNLSSQTTITSLAR